MIANAGADTTADAGTDIITSGYAHIFADVGTHFIANDVLPSSLTLAPTLTDSQQKQDTRAAVRPLKLRDPVP